ncbi:hypothetical protein PR202_gb11201 [Eleusine coracana subsp. coracana]|uniref:Mono-/di-acylglycerol lipase N-terminal domain-containing protein n=1 Tax=Eleusine coracana subsp. coracana TaxID=191504 RepID=A0AAV5EMG5_ELECO|nr:hypothetical protein PR202_gb11201 [Eleusine coracana subsp. coracana]
MALSGAAECALSLACARWAARRLSISGSDESASWPAATPASFKPTCLLCRCGRFPPQVRTAVPTEGRFEHVVLSCNAPADHGIIWIEREAQKALDLMEKEDRSTSPPAQQKMLRAQSLNTKRDAIEIRITENQVFPKEETSHDDAPSSPLDSPSTSTVSRSTSSSMGEQCEWDELVETFLSDLVQGDDLRHGGNGFVQCCDGLPAFSLYK